MPTQRQIEIIQASCALISESGIQGLTIKHLADRIGVTEAALYRHFDSKVDILRSMLEYVRENLPERIGPHLQEEGKAIDRLGKVMEGQFEYFSSHPEIVTVIFSEGMFKNYKELEAEVRSLMGTKKELLHSLIKQGQKDGSIRNDVDLEQMTYIFMGSMRLTIMRWNMSGNSFDLPAEGKKLWKSFETMFKPA